ncbi:hypothetical protein HYX70_03890 [Candidatus Saccharibacteria bacterium]|nr:hypothetical protein [Candidatus Saccharibacteria bacterium]
MFKLATKILAAAPSLPNALPQKGFGDIISTVTNTLLFLVGAAAVIGIIYGGFTYVTSGGDENRLRQAKEAIIYSVVGLVIALLSFLIVNFVIGVFR